MTEHVAIERRGAVQIIRMNRPDKKNALTRAMYAVMAGALTDGDADPDIRVHVFLGVPGAFTAGNDLADFLSYATGGEQGTEVYDFLLALANSQKPMIAGVDGVAVGLGTTMQLHCDVTIATQNALFRAPFIDLGLVPEAGSTLLGPAAIGSQNAFALLALGEDFSAERALQAGLIHSVVDAGELESAVLAKADEIAAKPPEALKLARDFLKGDRSAIVERLQEEGKLFRERLQSKEALAALTAFMTRK
ncbi:MAG: crotonase/enoyl-CoA hydratase family protein [Hyphomicrobiales bacterium]|nr:crotonase/enoyl-CoA hydratase family protein [Hyphomicrobiales bacterium]